MSNIFTVSGKFVRGPSRPEGSGYKQMVIELPSEPKAQMTADNLNSLFAAHVDKPEQLVHKTSSDEIAHFVELAFRAHPTEAQLLKQGSAQALSTLTAYVMKASTGLMNPALVSSVLLSHPLLVNARSDDEIRALSDKIADKYQHDYGYTFAICRDFLNASAAFGCKGKNCGS